MVHTDPITPLHKQWSRFRKETEIKSVESLLNFRNERISCRQKEICDSKPAGKLLLFLLKKIGPLFEDRKIIQKSTNLGEYFLGAYICLFERSF